MAGTRVERAVPTKTMISTDNTLHCWEDWTVYHRADIYSDTAGAKKSDSFEATTRARVERAVPPHHFVTKFIYRREAWTVKTTGKKEKAQQATIPSRARARVIPRMLGGVLNLVPAKKDVWKPGPELKITQGSHKRLIVSLHPDSGDFALPWDLEMMGQIQMGENDGFVVDIYGSDPSRTGGSSRPIRCLVSDLSLGGVGLPLPSRCVICWGVVYA
ncbi:hypothetical protein B0H13DRAFT_1892298 [Mycena leptocephala]|nr:hypothetical protein B0H13DRAFT_1892298 [Mycena leptocephala]